MPGELAADRVTFFFSDVAGKIEKLLVEQAQQRTKRLFVAAMGCGGDENHVPLGVGRDLSDQVEPLLATTTHAARQRAPVRLIHNDEFRALKLKVGRAAIALDKVSRDDGEMVAVKD